MSIGERIKRLRQESGLSQVEVAEKANISKQTLYKYENNIVTNIPLENIETLAKILSVTPGYIMGWENNEDYAQKLANKILALSEENRKLIETMIDKLIEKD